jgi:hypothetical protein
MGRRRLDLEEVAGNETQRREESRAAELQPQETAEYEEYEEKRVLRPHKKFVPACEQIGLLQCGAV